MSSRIPFSHRAVLLEACMDELRPREGGAYLDLTLGGAGHSSALLAALGSRGRLWAFDQDLEALCHSEEKLRAQAAAHRQKIDFAFFHENFAALSSVLEQERQRRGDVPASETSAYLFDGILADIGVSSYQLDEASRGFSYRHDGPLDMRMDQSRGRSAADVVNEASEKELADLLFRYGEEKNSRRIARAICERRRERPFTRTLELADLILGVQAKRGRQDKHPAKRSFQALRIAVNGELDVLDQMLEAACAALKPGGRLAVISFHSLEDRIVKQRFREWERGCDCPPKMPCVCGKKARGRVIVPKGIVADEEEVAQNPRAKSARLRVFEKSDECDEEGARGRVANRMI